MSARFLLRVYRAIGAQLFDFVNDGITLIVGGPLPKGVYVRWYYDVKQKMDLVSVGTAHLEAQVDAQGKIQKLRVLSNNSNESFANICLQSFQEAQIPPIPPDLVATLPEGRLPVDIYFTTYPNR